MSHLQIDPKKIDIVYTWVDGSDPIWRKKRQTALNNIQTTLDIEKHGNVEGRFRNNGELKYSLRSLEKYFPEHGDIYIVTDNQVPDFLKEHKDIKIVFHQDFMKPESLPTFSSKNIESQLVNIEWLSEVFLSLNDDFLFWPDFQIEDIFSLKPQYYFITWGDTNIQPPIISAASSEDILRSMYSDYNPMRFFVTHAPKIILKKEFLEMREEFWDIFTQVSQETFRDIKNPSLLADMFPRWMIHHKKWEMGSKQDVYVDSMRQDYHLLLDDFQNVPFFCINDNGDDIPSDHSSLLKISKVLKELFPDKSRYEK